MLKTINMDTNPKVGQPETFIPKVVCRKLLTTRVTSLAACVADCQDLFKSHSAIKFDLWNIIVRLIEQTAVL